MLHPCSLFTLCSGAGRPLVVDGLVDRPGFLARVLWFPRVLAATWPQPFPNQLVVSIVFYGAWGVGCACFLFALLRSCSSVGVCRARRGMGAMCFLVVLLHPWSLLPLWFGAGRPLVVDWLVDRPRFFARVFWFSRVLAAARPRPAPKPARRKHCV